MLQGVVYSKQHAWELCLLAIFARAVRELVYEAVVLDATMLQYASEEPQTVVTVVDVSRFDTCAFQQKPSGRRMGTCLISDRR